MTIVLPPKLEIENILTHIEAETALINNAIATIEKEVALVQEYRTAIIAEAVTGKIDVRGFELPSDTVETRLIASLQSQFNDFNEMENDDNFDDEIN